MSLTASPLVLRRALTTWRLHRGWRVLATTAMLLVAVPGCGPLETLSDRSVQTGVATSKRALAEEIAAADAFEAAPPGQANPPGVLALAELSPGAGGPADLSVPTAAATQRQMQYRAELQLLVTSIESTQDTIKKQAQTVGGYLVEQTRTTITLRVPAPVFDQTLAAIEGLGGVINRAVEARDVTDQYVDLQARLRNAQVVADRLKGLLAQAKTVSETLEVEREMRRIGEEIERLTGQLQLLREKVALSQITVRLSVKSATPTELEPLVRVSFGWIRDMDLTRLLRPVSR